MKRISLRILPFIFLIWLLPNVHAQQFQIIGVKEGISERNVQSITKDHLGYMWFATLGGLDRYDGYRIEKYSQQEFGLLYDSFRTVAEDGGNHLWAVSSGGQIYLYDRLGNRLTDRIEPVLSDLGIPSSGITKLFVDQGKDLWVESSGNLYHYSFNRKQLETFPKVATCNSIAGNGITAFAAFSNGEIRQLIPETRILFKEGARRRSSLYLDASGRLWKYGISAGPVSFFDQRTDKWNGIEPNEITSHDYINAVIDDGTGRIWLGSGSSGILVLSDDLKSLQTIQHEVGNKQTIPSNHINCFHLGDENILWIGTGKNGLAFTPLESLKIEKMSLGVSEDVGTILEDEKGALWIGFDGQGLFRHKDAKLTRYDAESGSLPSDNIVGSTLLPDGTPLFTSYGGGVFAMDESTCKPLENPNPDFQRSTRFSRNILMDSEGKLWIITFGQGIGYLSKDGRWIRFTNTNSPLISNSMTSIASTRTRDIFYASTSECIYRINTKTATLEKFLECRQVHNLFVDSRDILWIGTSEGLCFLDTRSKSVLCQLKESDGISNPHIQGIGEDRKGNLWVTTDNGFTYLYIIDDPMDEKLTIRCYPFYEEDGIGDSPFTKGTVFCAGNGDILMGTGGQVLRVRPDDFIRIKRPNSLSFTGIGVSGKNIPIPEKGTSDKIRIKYKDILDIEVSAMDYLNRNKIRYEYAIDHKGNWNLMQGNVLFINGFQPGNHLLYVRIAGTGNTDIMPLALQISVAPPFWKSWIAFSLYAFCFILILAFILNLIQSRNRKLLDQEKHEVNEAKLRFFTNIGHDLRTPLTMIITPLGKLLRENKGKPIEKDLDLINRSAHTLMGEIDRLLEFRKIDKAKVSFKPSYGDLVKFINDLCSSFNLLFIDDSVSFTLEPNEEPILMDFDRDKMMRIIQNLLSNAFKYNNPGGYVKVSVQKDRNDAVISVEDSGIGISDEGKRHIFERFYQDHRKEAVTGNGIGLHIAAEYVKLHGGKISVTDNHPKGSIFTVTIPIKHEELSPKSKEPGGEQEPDNRSQAASGKARILIVEDNDPFRKFLKDSLSERYKVIEAGNGRSGLEKLASHPIDIIVSDIMMPEMDGLELCKQVKNDIRYSHIPIILLTARQQQENALIGLREGADEYISKPFDFEILTLKIDNLLKWTQDNHRKIGDLHLDTSDITASKIDKDLLDKTIGLIEKHLTDSEYSVEELSAEVGISRSSLYKKLMFITGKSPLEFIRIIRIKRGLEMLESGETSISQIAWQVGFSPKQFSKYFKDEYGCLPSEYQQNIQ